MAKGVSIKFSSYEETIHALLSLIKLDEELKKHPKIILKPNLKNSQSPGTNPEFVEQVLKFCLEYKNPATDIFIAEGSDGEDTMDLFESRGYKKLAEKYSVGLIDLNNAETESLDNLGFLKFDKIQYPSILLESFVISLPNLSQDSETGVMASLSNMLGAFPARHYSGFLSKSKSKIRKWPIEYSIHDIIQCKAPDFAIIDASEYGSILAGVPLEMDKQSTKLLEESPDSVPYLRVMEDSMITPQIDGLQ